MAMPQDAPLQSNPESAVKFTACGNCHAPMPSQLRFCRNCGYRLGEGPAEYTETALFPNARPMPPFAGSAGQLAPAGDRSLKRRKKGLGGISWIFIAVILFFVLGGAASYLAPPFRRAGAGFGVGPPKPFFGVSGFRNTEGGVTFEAVDPPGGPADKAGLIGGDVIVAFAGQTITNSDQMSELLSKQPIGKTSDLVFIRDGDTKTTKITTISKGDFDQLANAFRRRPEGQGKLGINDYDSVEVPGTKIHGVQITVDDNMAAALAGLVNGDIIIEFDKVPIRTRGELEARIHRGVPYSIVPVVIMRGNNRLEIPVKLGRR